jgi:pimeloyl-ACP methyl ester carboxylesterase
MKRWSIALAGVLIVAAGCGADDSTSEPATSEPSTSVADEAVDQVAEARVVAGGFGEGQVIIDGTPVDYVTVVPEGFEVGDEAPVLLAFPPGGQSLGLTRSLVENTYLGEAVARGWVVVSPAAPGGQLFFQGSEALVPGLMDWIETWVTPENRQIHLAGVSNGGLSAFRIAGQQPDRVASVIAFPGHPLSDEDVAALAKLTDIPVRMFAGETDTGWVVPMQDTEAALNDLGGNVTLFVFPEEGHIIGALSNGVQIFDELDSAR